MKAKLAFHRYGDQSILAKAELPNGDSSRSFQTTAESHVIKVAGAVSQARAEVVEIAEK